MSVRDLTDEELVDAAEHAASAERRERIATLVLAGFAANSATGLNPNDAAETAIVWAECFIAALDIRTQAQRVGGEA